MQTIKETVSAVLARLKAEQGKALEEGPASWLGKVFSKKELGHIRLQYYRKGVLGLTADSSTWLYHLNLRRTELLAALQKAAPEVKDLRVKLGQERQPAQNYCCKRAKR